MPNDACLDHATIIGNDRPSIQPSLVSAGVAACTIRTHAFTRDITIQDSQQEICGAKDEGDLRKAGLDPDAHRELSHKELRRQGGGEAINSSTGGAAEESTKRRDHVKLGP